MKTDLRIAEFQARWLEGKKTIWQICDDMGVSPWAGSRWVLPVLPPDIDDQIARLWHQGLNDIDICLKVRISRASVKSRLRKMGLRRFEWLR